MGRVTRAANPRLPATRPRPSPNDGGRGVPKADRRRDNGVMADGLGLRWLPSVSLSPQARRRWQHYLRFSRRPLHSLIFLAPFVLWYELGAARPASGTTPGGELLAHGVIQDLLSWFGFVGAWLPPFVLVITLLVAHKLRRDRWRVRWSVFPAMVLECALLALPLLALSALFEAPPAARLRDALGAGIYEELVFRMLLLGGLTWLALEILRIPRPSAVWVAVALGAILFALCHFAPLGSEAPAWKPFWFKTAAGVYLAVVFLGRGLGVAAGSHAAYNMLLVWLRSSPG